MALNKLVDLSLLSRFLSKIKLMTSRKTSAIPFGDVDGTSTSTVYTATIDGITTLYDGVCMWLKNGVVTSESGFTININNLGAKPVYSSLAAATRCTTVFNANYTMLFVYNSTRVSGGCWDCVYGYDSNTNTIGYQLRTNSTTLPVSGATYRYRLLFTSADGTYYVPANTSTSTNATASRTVNQTKIDPFGAIRYYSYTTAVSSGSSPGASYLWGQYNVTLGYSFNRTGAALTLTSKKPVYIKCAPQSDGSAIMDSTTPYVQDLPTVDDGKIYIFLGIATAATTIELVPEHPVYCCRNGAIQLWTGVQEEIDGLKQDFADDITDINLKLQYDSLVMTLSNGVLTLDTVVGVQAFMLAFASGSNFLLLLPVAYLTGEQTTDAISFQITSVDTNTAKITLSAIYDGKAYYASMSPVSQTALSGELNVTSLTYTNGDEMSY